MFTFNGPTSLREVALMSDSDIGGSSSIALRLGEPDEAEESWAMKRTPFGVFQGHMSLAIREELEGKRRGGYVGWRTKVRCPLSPCLPQTSPSTPSSRSANDENFAVCSGRYTAKSRRLGPALLQPRVPHAPVDTDPTRRRPKTLASLDAQPADERAS